MDNQEIAKILYEISEYLAIEDVPFKPQAYEKAAIGIESLEGEVVDIYKKEGLKGLMKIPGIGRGIAERIEELIRTGKIKDYEKMKKKMPVKLAELTAVEGVGPKIVAKLYKELGIRNLEDLEKAARAGKIRHLEDFGEKTEQNILQGIAFLKRSKGRFLLGEILSPVREVYEKLKRLKEVEKIDYCGSIRRMKETIGDVDFLVTVDDSKGSAFAKASADAIADFFVSLPGVIKIWGKGSTKASVRMRGGFDMDIRIVPKKSYGAALQYFTGSKDHNIVLRKIAIDKGLKLSEYGLFSAKGGPASGGRMIAGETEEGIYKRLKMDWIPAEMRENQGEVEAALKFKLPKIINYNDIKGDLHCHSDWDGGANSIEEIALAVQEMGYQYIGIADHTKFLRIEHGLDEKEIIQRNKEIDKFNEKFKNFKILKGCEANILNDGYIDIRDDVLAKLDFVIAGVHSSFKMEKNKMTERIIKAIKNPNVDILSHPTGRLIQRRDEYQIDFDKILRVARETKAILEINAFPERLDLNDQNIRRAKETGVKMVINTDSHHIDQLGFIEFGIAQARRGWAEKKDIINAWSVEKMLGMLK